MLIRGHISPHTLSGPVKHSGWPQGDKEVIITTGQRPCRRAFGKRAANRNNWVEDCLTSECRLTAGVLDLKSAKPDTEKEVGDMKNISQEDPMNFTLASSPGCRR